jgi:protein TonB
MPENSHDLTTAEPAAWGTVRTILVPQDIVGVRPRSPTRIKRSTPWHPQPEAHSTTARCGDRDWFSDRLFVESQEGHGRTGYGTSITVHLLGLTALIVFLFSQPDVITIHMPSLSMPISLAPPPPEIPVLGAPAVAQAQPKTTVDPAPPPPPPPAERPSSEDPVPAPVDAPTGVSPETGAESRVKGGVQGGVPGGVAGGVPGGVVGGSLGGTGTGTLPRVGVNIQAPRKIKDVKPVYPDGALPSRSQGAVVVEAVIGPDGKIQAAKVIHSVAGLDQAALDAVRQWEYTPSMLNGVAVAVVMTVVVNFTMQ